MLAPAQAQVDFGAPIVSHRSTRLSKGLATGFKQTLFIVQSMRQQPWFRGDAGQALCVSGLQDVPAQARSTGNPSTINVSGESRRIFPLLAHYLALTLIRSAPHFSKPRFD